MISMTIHLYSYNDVTVSKMPVGEFTSVDLKRGGSRVAFFVPNDKADALVAALKDCIPEKTVIDEPPEQDDSDCPF